MTATSAAYYRLGQAYPRRRLREPYPARRRRFVEWVEPGPTAGPYRVTAGTVFVAGAVVGQAFTAGAVAGSCFTAGPALGQVAC